jgi:hypothetical protein
MDCKSYPNPVMVGRCGVDKVQHLHRHCSGGAKQAARPHISCDYFCPFHRRFCQLVHHACRLIQNSGLVPKKRAKRKAVSAVTARSPLTMAPMRVAGTRKAIAKALTDIARVLRNSLFRTSPGWAVTRLGRNGSSDSRRFRHRWAFLSPALVRNRT